MLLLMYSMSPVVSGVPLGIVMRGLVISGAVQIMKDGIPSEGSTFHFTPCNR
jgi:hypothetical protein